MKISDVETFLAIVETGSFTRAAEEMFLSQSTVSHQIKTLEDTLGITLLRRQKGQRDVELTEKVEAFLQLSKRMIELWQDMQSLRNLQNHDSLSIGAPRGLLTHTLPLLVKELKSIQALNLKILSYRSHQVYSAVENREIDIGLAFEQTPRSSHIASEVLFHERLCLIRLYRNNITQGPINLKDLNSRDEIYFPWFPEYVRWHDACWGQGAKCFVEINTSVLLPTILNDPQQWAIVPISLAKYFEKTIPIGLFELQPPPPNRTCYKLTRNNLRAQDTHALKIVNSVIKSFCKNLPWEE